VSNSNRDAQGRWSSANVQGHTPSNTPNAGGGEIQAHTPSTTPNAGGMQPAASMAHDDAWPGAANPSSELTSHTGGAGRGPGMGGNPVGRMPVKDYSSAYRAMGFSGYSEGPGDHQVQHPAGPAQNGRDVPGSGVPGPTDPSDPGGGLGDVAPTAGAGGAEAAGAEAGVEELAPLALAL
jgi:hypothetical protein